MVSVWTALRAMRGNTPIRGFRTSKYIPLPVHAIEVPEEQDSSLYEQPDPHRIGALNLIDAILNHLAVNREAPETVRPPRHSS